MPSTFAGLSQTPLCRQLAIKTCIDPVRSQQREGIPGKYNSEVLNWFDHACKVENLSLTKPQTWCFLLNLRFTAWLVDFVSCHTRLYRYLDTQVKSCNYLQSCHKSLCSSTPFSQLQLGKNSWCEAWEWQKCLSTTWGASNSPGCANLGR